MSAVSRRTRSCHLLGCLAAAHQRRARRAPGRPRPSRGTASRAGSPRGAAPPAAGRPRAPRHRGRGSGCGRRARAGSLIAARAPAAPAARRPAWTASRPVRAQQLLARAPRSRRGRPGSPRAARRPATAALDRSARPAASRACVAIGSASYGPSDGTVTSAAPAASASSCERPWSSRREAFTNTRVRLSV